MNFICDMTPLLRVEDDVCTNDATIPHAGKEFTSGNRKQDSRVQVEDFLLHREDGSHHSRRFNVSESQRDAESDFNLEKMKLRVSEDDPQTEDDHQSVSLMLKLLSVMSGLNLFGLMNVIKLSSHHSLTSLQSAESLQDSQHAFLFMSLFISMC